MFYLKGHRKSIIEWKIETIFYWRIIIKIGGHKQRDKNKSLKWQNISLRSFLWDIFNQLKTSWKKNKTKDYINSIHTFKEQVLKIYILSKEAPEGFSQRWKTVMALIIYVVFLIYKTLENRWLWLKFFWTEFLKFE